MKLAPCPFCGSTNVELGSAYIPPEYFIVCRDCHSGTGHSPAQIAIIEAWNRRVPDADRIILLELAQDLADELRDAHDLLVCYRLRSEEGHEVTEVLKRADTILDIARTGTAGEPVERSYSAAEMMDAFVAGGRWYVRQDHLHDAGEEALKAEAERRYRRKKE